MVQATIDRIRTTSPMLNQIELNTWNSCSRSSASTTPGGQRRVVDRVELVHLVGVVGRRAEREARQLAQRHADDREQREDADLEDGEVDRGQQAPDGVGDAGRDARARDARPAAGRRWSRWRPPRRWRPASAWPRSGLGAPGLAAFAASSACPKSATRSASSSRPTDTRRRPSVMPAAASDAGVERAVGRRRRVDDHRVDAAQAGGPLRDRRGRRRTPGPRPGRRRGRPTASRRRGRGSARRPRAAGGSGGPGR